MVDTNKGLVVSGAVVMALGLVLGAYFWPMFGYETRSSLTYGSILPGESFRYVGTVTDKQFVEGYDYWGYVQEDAYYIELDNGLDIEVTPSEYLNYNVGDSVMVSGVAGAEEETYTVEKVPTTLGIVGVIIAIVGIVLLIVGFAIPSRRAAMYPPPQQAMGYQPPPPPVENRICMSCGRQIQASFNVCPFCGHSK